MVVILGMGHDGDQLAQILNGEDFTRMSLSCQTPTAVNGRCWAYGHPPIKHRRKRTLLGSLGWQITQHRPFTAVQLIN